jgi:hypothetical protein
MATAALGLGPNKPALRPQSNALRTTLCPVRIQVFIDADSDKTADCAGLVNAFFLAVWAKSNELAWQETSNG